MHFKSKLLEIRKIFFVLNSMLIIYIDYFVCCAHFFNFVSFLLYPMEVKMLKCAMLGAFTVYVIIFDIMFNELSKIIRKSLSSFLPN